MSIKSLVFRYVCTTCWCSHASAIHAEAPYIDPAEDYKHFGAPDNVLFWAPEQQVAGYRNSDKIFPTRTIRAGDSMYELPYELADSNDVEISLNDTTMTVDEHFVRQSVAGTLLRSAVGNNLATYLSEKIWRPFGMESDGAWNLTESGGGEFGGCCINATLRDYGRVGLFASAAGRLADGTEVLPQDWMKESTTPSKGNEGYGSFWWPHGKGVFSASGIFGQTIYINRDEKLVIALHSARPAASNDLGWAWEDALFNAITEAIRD